jgi:hypothetical protein
MLTGVADDGRARLWCLELVAPIVRLTRADGQVGALPMQFEPLVPVPAVVATPLGLLLAVLQWVWPRLRVPGRPRPVKVAFGLPAQRGVTALAGGRQPVPVRWRGSRPARAPIRVVA